MDLFFRILLVFVLVFLNGYFVASEYALIGIRKTRVDELVRRGNKRAGFVQQALTNLDSVISATQLGITLASLALGWIGEPTIARFIEPLFVFLPKTIADVTTHTISAIIAFSIITFLHIVLGELTPKNIALQKSESVSFLTIAPLLVFMKVFHPFIVLLNSSGNIILKSIHISPPSRRKTVLSEEEIKMILSQSAESGTIKQKEAEMVYKIFNLGDIPVRTIMVPRTEIIAFSESASIKSVLQRAIKNPHSRFPVYQDSIDTIVGFVHIKDIYKIAVKLKESKELTDTNIIRDTIHVPESKRADEVLLDMRRKRVHIAIVNDEYGGTSGIVTLEDILESIVGEIEDEFETPSKDIQKITSDEYIVNGLVPVDIIQSRFNLPLRGQGYTTIGGLVFGLIGREPKIGDNVQIGNIILEVENLEGRRIKRIKLKKIQKKKS